MKVNQFLVIASCIAAQAAMICSFALPAKISIVQPMALGALYGGWSPPCESSDHELCPSDGSCTSQQCDAVTLMCPDPTNPAILDTYYTFNCNASDSVNVAIQYWYPVCDSSVGFNGYRGSLTGTFDCGYAQDCYVPPSQCYTTPVCKPQTDIDPNTGQPTIVYYCPGYNDQWDLLMESCTPDSSKPICRLLPEGGRVRGQTLAALISANGLLFRVN